MSISKEDVLDDWYNRILYAQFCHSEAARACDRTNCWLGLSVVVLSTVAGTWVFAQVGDSGDSRWPIAIGLISVAAAVLASIQTFFRFAERAEKHRTAAANYSNLRRQVEEILALQAHDAPGSLTALRRNIDHIAEAAPHIPHRIWARRQKAFREDQDNLTELLNQ